METELTISNIAEYIQFVCQKNHKERKEAFIYKKMLLFRGQANKNYELLPSIGRNRDEVVDYTIFNEERNLIEMAKYRLPDIFRAEQSPIELLALLQHHGIPTRLLDVTENALVALYFACCSQNDADGEVIVFSSPNHDVTNYPVVNAIADSYRFSHSTWHPLSDFYANVKNQPYFLEQKLRMDTYHENNEAGGRWIEECCENILFLYAPIRSMRQQVQHGRYILFPNTIQDFQGEKCFVWKINAIPKDHKNVAARIVIPKESKKQLLDDLSVLGITESSLFCDSVDTVCKGIVDSFKRRL